MAASMDLVHYAQNPWNWRLTVCWDIHECIITDLDVHIRNLLSGGQRNDPVAICAAAQDYIQMIVDAGYPGRPSSRFLLSTMDVDDPDRTIDPARPDHFHARVTETLGSGPNRVDIYRPTNKVGGIATHMIDRGFMVYVTWDANIQYPHFEYYEPPIELR